MELGMRGRVRLGKATAQRRNLADRLVQVVNTEPTGEGLLDETLKVLLLEEHSVGINLELIYRNVGTWIDLLSGNHLLYQLMIKGKRGIHSKWAFN